METTQEERDQIRRDLADVELSTGNDSARVKTAYVRRLLDHCDRLAQLEDGIRALAAGGDMSERVICEKATDDYGHDYGVPDPDAPSVDEIVGVLREVYEGKPNSDDVFLRIADIIARLEGA